MLATNSAGKLGTTGRRIAQRKTEILREPIIVGRHTFGPCPHAIRVDGVGTVQGRLISNRTVHVIRNHQHVTGNTSRATCFFLRGRLKCNDRLCSSELCRNGGGQAGSAHTDDNDIGFGVPFCREVSNRGRNLIRASCCGADKTRRRHAYASSARDPSETPARHNVCSHASSPFNVPVLVSPFAYRKPALAESGGTSLFDAVSMGYYGLR